MKIVREALAGTQESSDLMVKIAPADGELEIVIHSEVMKQFGEQIRQVVEETLRTMGVQQGLVIVEDKGGGKHGGVGARQEQHTAAEFAHFSAPQLMV